MKTRVTVAVFVLLLLSLSSVPVGLAASNSTSPFTVLSANWGTAAKATEAAPGGTNVPLTLTILYSGTTLEATTVQGVLELAGTTINQQVVGGFTDIFGNTTTLATAFDISPSSTFTLTYYLDIANSTQTGIYSIPLLLEWTNPTVLGSGYFVQSTTVPVRMLGIPDLVFSASPLTLVPGSVTNVTMTVSNEGSGVASQIAFSLSASDVSILKTVFEVPSLYPGKSASFETGVYVPTQGVSSSGSALSLSGSSVNLNVGATYYDAYGNGQSVDQTIGMYAGRTFAPSLNFQVPQNSVLPGQTNIVSVTLTNLGTGSASLIHTEITSSSSFSVLGQFPFVAILEPGSSVKAEVSIYVPLALSGSPLTLTITSSYNDQYGDAGSLAQTLGLYVVSTNSTQTNRSVSVKPLTPDVKVGMQSKVAFLVEDIGNTSLTSPIISLGASSPLVVLENASYPLPEGVLQSGQSVVYEAVLGAGTSSTPGYYTETMTVSYLDQLGNLNVVSFSFGVVLSGTIDLVIQSPQVTQSTSSISVSGTVLNEGFSPAYYTSVTGSLANSKSSSTPDYVGEVDPNTPIPFSVTIPYTPKATTGQSGNIAIVLTYEDSLGIAGNATTTVATTLQSLTQLESGSATTSASSSGIDVLTLSEYGIVAGLVVIAVIGIVYIRRSRGRTRSGREAGDKQAESEVI